MHVYVVYAESSGCPCMFMPLSCHSPTSSGQKRLNALVTIVTASLLLPFAVTQMAMSEVSVNPVYLRSICLRQMQDSLFSCAYTAPLHIRTVFECIDLVYV